MHQEHFSILSARVPSGSLPQSILNEFSARFHSLYSVAQPESALFVGTYAKVSASSARSHQLYQNANVFGLERSISSAPKVQQLDICIQRRSCSQANGRSDFFCRISVIAHKCRAFGTELCRHEPALPVFNTDASPLKCVCAVSYFG